MREADGVHSRVPFFTYPDDMDLAHKIDAVARRVYGARGATFTAQAMKQLKTMEDEGFGRCPVCIAKTQYSFSDDAKRRNAPTDFDINIRSRAPVRRRGLCGGLCRRYYRHARVCRAIPPRWISTWMRTDASKGFSDRIQRYGG